MLEEVVLVDFDDHEIGTSEKLMAHEHALLHRAFSVFLYQNDFILLQKRASTKYHCAGLWTNSCCSHPRPGEKVALAAERRVQEELGISDCSLTELFHFFYHVPFSNGLTEFECDHVLLGEYSRDLPLNPAPEEVDEIQWWKIDDLLNTMLVKPEEFTPWFIISAPKVISVIQSHLTGDTINN